MRLRTTSQEVGFEGERMKLFKRIKSKNSIVALNDCIRAWSDRVYAPGGRTLLPSIRKWIFSTSFVGNCCIRQRADSLKVSSSLPPFLPPSPLEPLRERFMQAVPELGLSRAVALSDARCGLHVQIHNCWSTTIRYCISQARVALVRGEVCGCTLVCTIR